MESTGMSVHDLKKPEILVAIDKDTFVAMAAARIAGEIRRAIGEHGRCTIALCGGETPMPVYEALAGEEISGGIDWTRIRFFFSDERCVPPNHPDSNFRMAWESLLQHIPIAPSAVERMKAEEPDRVKAAEDYSAKLPSSIDIVLLGVGEDGHTASLFPGSPALREELHLVVPVEGVKPPRYRLTVTPPAIRNAGVRIVMATGLNKASAIARALEGPYAPEEVPIQAALNGVWIIDREAASMLKGAQGLS
jgi:6-phosphogluconolactonase